MEDKEHQPGAGVSENSDSTAVEPAVITNDPDAPVLSEVTEEDVAPPAPPVAPDDSDESNSGSDSSEESLTSADVSENAPSVITNDADEDIATPTTPDDSDGSVSGPDSYEDVVADAAGEESLQPAAENLSDAPVVSEVSDEDVTTPVTPDDSGDRSSVPDTDTGGGEGLDSPEPTLETILVVATADPDENGVTEIEPDTAPVLTADPDESLFPPGGSDEVSPDQFLVGVEQPKKDDEIARRLAVLEAIIYVTDEPLSAEQIAKAMGEPLADVKLLLDQLVAEYNRAEHGLTVKEVAGGYKMATKPEHHEAVRTFVKNLNPPLKLSLAALETLAVIAYKQPITAPEIMEVRGVQGAGVLKTLLDRKLITTAGRKNVVGKPILYKTTKEFLVQFGLRDLAELPTLKEFEDLRRMAFSDADDVLGAAEAAPPATPEASEESEE